MRRFTQTQSLDLGDFAHIPMVCALCMEDLSLEIPICALTQGIDATVVSHSIFHQTLPWSNGSGPIRITAIPKVIHTVDG